MKKIFIAFILSLSIFLISGCRKEIETKVDEKPVGSNIDIDLNNIGKTTIETSQNKKSIIYKDEEYGFTVELPSWWEGKYTVKHEDWMDENSRGISFNFEDGYIYSNIFTIIIMNEEIKKENWEDPFLMYLVVKDGKTYSYLQAMEPTEELLEEENDKYLYTISKMVKEVPQIIETFKIEK